MYKDNWLPRPNTFKPMSPPRMLIHTVVADLIKARNQWDEDKLNQHFIQEDLEVILNTSLLREKAKDEVMWHYDKRGEYSVKGGYQLALKLKYPRHPAAQEITQGTGIHYGLLRFLKKLKYLCGGL